MKGYSHLILLLLINFLTFEFIYSQNESISSDQIIITAANGEKIMALYKDCKNDLNVQIVNFNDYKNIEYKLDGGDLILDKDHPNLVSIRPRTAKLCRRLCPHKRPTAL